MQAIPIQLPNEEGDMRIIKHLVHHDMPCDPCLFCFLYNPYIPFLNLLVNLQVIYTARQFECYFLEPRMMDEHVYTYTGNGRIRLDSLANQQLCRTKLHPVVPSPLKLVRMLLCQPICGSDNYIPFHRYQRIFIHRSWLQNIKLTHVCCHGTS